MKADSLTQLFKWVMISGVRLAFLDLFFIYLHLKKLMSHIKTVFTLVQIEDYLVFLAPVN